LDPGIGLNELPDFKMAFTGEYIPLMTVKIEKKWRLDPAIYIMKDVIRTCFTGEKAMFCNAAVLLS
jgi:hypothetical protein